MRESIVIISNSQKYIAYLFICKKKVYFCVNERFNTKQTITTTKVKLAVNYSEILRS